jgi:hypothetical protein
VEVFPPIVNSREPGHIDQVSAENLIPERRDFTDLGEESMTANIESIVFVEHGACESTDLGVAFKHAGRMALTGEEIPGRKPRRPGATDESTVASYKAPHLSRGFRRVHSPNLPFKS